MTDNCSTGLQASGTVGNETGSGCSYSTTKTWTVTDGCGNTQSATQTVSYTRDTEKPMITVTPAATLPCNPTSAQIAAAFGTASVTDNCSTGLQASGTVGNETGSGCSYSTTKTWTVTDACGNTQSATQTVSYTRDITKPVVTNNPPTTITANCQTLFANLPWEAPTFTDNCGTPVVTMVTTPDQQQQSCPSTYSRTWTATDGCGNTASFTQTITVPCCAFCTYTQGYYGNAGGTSCDGTTGGYSTTGLITQSLTNLGGSLQIGRPGKSVIILNNAANVNCVIDKLPGGGPAKELVNGDFNICSLHPSYTAGSGRIRNVLLAQTITLGLNLGIAPSPTGLGSFVLQGGVLATAAPDGGCGSNTPKVRSCYYNPVAPYNLIVVNEYQYKTIDPNVIAAIAGPKTVANLLALANDALANTDGVVGTENGVSISSIASTVGAINEGFDECRIFVGWNVPSCVPSSGRIAISTPETEEALKVNAFPNPYENGSFNLKINAPVSGIATIQLYTIDGVLITEMKKMVIKDKEEVLNLTVPGLIKTKLAYHVVIGSYNSKGIVLSPN